jgi:hypothetical protein
MRSLDRDLKYRYFEYYVVQSNRDICLGYVRMVFFKRDNRSCNAVLVML